MPKMGSIPKESTERVMIFIDGSNLYHGLKNNIGNTHIDFRKFGQLLCGARKLIRIYYYNVTLIQSENKEEYKRQQQFFEKLKLGVPYLTVKLGRLEKRPYGYVEKGVDVKIAVDMLVYAYRDTYDTAILVSGDGDFADVVEGVEELGKHVEVAYFSKAMRLRQVADKFIELDSKFLKSCLF